MARMKTQAVVDVTRLTIDLGKKSESFPRPRFGEEGRVRGASRLSDSLII